MVVDRAVVPELKCGGEPTLQVLPALTPYQANLGDNHFQVRGCGQRHLDQQPLSSLLQPQTKPDFGGGGGGGVLQKISLLPLCGKYPLGK